MGNSADRGHGAGPSRARRLAMSLASTLLLWLLVAMPVAAEPLFQTELSRTAMALGERVTLRLRAVGDLTGDPDLTPLLTDFAILDQTQRSSFDSDAQNVREWSLSLAPRRAGSLAVPSLELGGLKSALLRLDVSPAPASGADAEAPGSEGKSPTPALPQGMLSMEVDAQPSRPYVQSRIRYRVRILARVPLRQATLSEPRADMAQVRRLGDDRRYDVERNGVRYRVLERLYAIVPQRPGSLHIVAPVLSAAVPVSALDHRDQGARAGGGAVFERLESVSRSDPELVLPVSPVPAAAPMPWLPAESVSISERWQPERGEVRVGEPITRTVVIEASGVLGASIPELESAPIDGFQVYPQPPQITEQVSGEDLMVTAELRQTLVPTLAGIWQLPPVRLPWWSLGMDAPRRAELPARSISVLDPSAAADASADSTAGALDSTRDRLAAPAPDGLRHGHWLIPALALGWALTLLLWLRERRRGGQGRGQVAEPSIEPRNDDCLRRLRRACQMADARAARTALLDWGRMRWPARPPRGPVDLMLRLGADERALGAAAEIERALYAPDGEGRIDRSTLDSLMPALDNAAPRPSAEASGLPPLYPEVPAG